MEIWLHVGILCFGCGESAAAAALRHRAGGLRRHRRQRSWAGPPCHSDIQPCGPRITYSDITTTITTTSALRSSPQAVTAAGCFRLSHHAAVPTRQHITSSSSAHPRHAHGLAWRLNRLAGLHSRMLRKQAHRHCRIRITSARPHNHRQMPTSLRYALGCRRSSTMPILTPARVRHSRPHPTRPVITTASQILSQALLHSPAPISLSHPQRLARRNPDANRQEAP